MQFIRLPKWIDIGQRVLPELVADWVDTKSVQSINISILQQLLVNVLVSWAIKWSKTLMPHQWTLRNSTHSACTIWDLSNLDLFQIIPDQGSHQRVTLSPESISKIPCLARTSNVKMPKLRLHSFNSDMSCIVNVSCTYWGPGDQPDGNPSMLLK